MITEIIEFELKEGISNEKLVQQADKVVTGFHKNQDGYADMELIGDNSGTRWQMIVHYQTMDDIEKVKINIPQSQEIKNFTALIKANTMKVTFYEQKGIWAS